MANDGETTKKGFIEFIARRNPDEIFENPKVFFKSGDRQASAHVWVRNTARGFNIAELTVENADSATVSIYEIDAERLWAPYKGMQVDREYVTKYMLEPLLFKVATYKTTEEEAVAIARQVTFTNGNADIAEFYHMYSHDSNCLEITTRSMIGGEHTEKKTREIFEMQSYPSHLQSLVSNIVAERTDVFYMDSSNNDHNFCESLARQMFKVPQIYLVSLRTGTGWSYYDPGGPGNKQDRVNTINPKSDKCFTGIREKVINSGASNVVYGFLTIANSTREANERARESSIARKAKEHDEFTRQSKGDSSPWKGARERGEFVSQALSYAPKSRYRFEDLRQGAATTKKTARDRKPDSRCIILLDEKPQIRAALQEMLTTDQIRSLLDKPAYDRQASASR